MSNLPEHLRAAAKLFTAIVKNNGGQAILMGGAASKALGSPRDTKASHCSLCLPSALSPLIGP